MVLDLTACAQEPIHTPGHIQPHGALIIFNDSTLVVKQASTNLSLFLAVEPAAAVGRPLAQVLSAEAMVEIEAALEQVPPVGQNFQLFPLPRNVGRVPLIASIHRNNGQTLLELERLGAADAGDAGTATVEAAFADQVATASTPYHVARLATEAFTTVTRYDRVMVYQFAPDWSGEIIAEIRAPAATPFLGQHFPATDIPEQARRLYRSNILRVIVDVDAPPVPLIAAAGAPTDSAPIDMSYGVLRAVSPVHLQYLRNMGVAATLVVSLIVDGVLWGLVACHHQRPRTVEPVVRASAARLGRMAAVAIERLERCSQVAAERRMMANLASIERAIGKADNLVQELICGDPNLFDLANADGVAVRAGNAVACFGLTPPPECIERLMPLLAERPDQFLATECLRRLDPDADAYRDVASGMMAVGLRDQPGVVLAAFRRELVHDVAWGGDPAKPMESDGEVLTPRSSFALWRETVIGQCRPWEPDARAAWLAFPAWLACAYGSYTTAGQHLHANLTALRTATRLDEPLLQALLNTMAGTLLTRSGTGGGSDNEVVASNRAFRRAFGVTPEQLVGHSIADALAGIGLHDPQYARLCPGHSAEARLVSAELGERIFDVVHQPMMRLKSPGYDTLYAAWVFEDRTQVRRSEQALRSARDQAMLASRAKSEFLANMSHEMRTPLNAIIGFSEIMRAELFGALGSPRYRDYIKNIESAGEHLLKIIGDILDISKVEAGKYVLEEHILDLGSLIDEVCRLEQGEAERSGLKLMQDMAPGRLLLQGDERALRQILLNLLSNSFKFTPAGGVVTCRTLRAPDHAVTLEVQDTGPGIPEDYLQQVLEPYVQVARPMFARRDAGTGLGLSVVRVLSDLHEARLTVTSQPGRGSLFRINFPSWRSVGDPDPAPLA